MLCKVHHCAGHVLANTRLHQLCWGDWEMGTAVSCAFSNILSAESTYILYSGKFLRGSSFTTFTIKHQLVKISSSKNVMLTTS